MNSATFRQIIRQQRRQLKAAERAALSLQLTSLLSQQTFFIHSNAVACYWPFDGEIDTLPIIKTLWSLNKLCYLPIIDAENKLVRFAEYTETDLLQKNCYGIAEPSKEKAITLLQSIDLILLPIVAFDTLGHRLGTGGGYYDRTLHSLRSGPRPAKPLLVGLAYEFQKIDSLQPQSWDVTLDGIITEQQFYSTTLGNPA